MLEISLWSLLVGSLGMEAVAAGAWLRWRQFILLAEQEEEEIVTRYESKEDIVPVNPDQLIVEHPYPNGTAKKTPRDSRLNGWEFKIVRASQDLFRDPTIFQRLCEEEAQAGWILLEKLDDRRVRFKRPIALRELINPEMLSFDPYRSHYGPTSNLITWLSAIAALMAIILPAYLGYALVSSTMSKSPHHQPNAPTPQLPPPEFPPLP